jgi:hypothetical protein
MAAISVTYTFTNGTVIDAGQVNTNFSDIIAGTSDGTKDFNIAALTAAGTSTFNGNVLLGNASADDIQFNGSLATSIPVKTTATYNVGSSTLGLLSLYLSLGASATLRILGSTSGSPASWTLTIPSTAGLAGQGLLNAGSGTMEWKPQQVNATAQSGDYTILDNDGFRTVNVTTSTSARTITLPTLADNAGRIITIKKVDSAVGTIIVDGENSETIDGDTTVTITDQYQSITVHAGATEWNIITPKLTGQKVYYAGSTYNGGTGPTVSGTNVFSWFRPFQEAGNWFLEFSFQTDTSSSVRTDATITLGLGGAVFYDGTPNSFQVVAGSAQNGTLPAAGRCNDNAATVQISHASTTTTNYGAYGTARISAKPSWAY